MQESEAKKILMALDGLAAYLETIRNLVISSIEAEQLEEEAPKSVGKQILDMIPSDKCLHPKTIEANSFSGMVLLCEDCSEQL